MNLSLNQKIALGFLVLVLTYGSLGYISLQNLDKSREITNKNLFINQPSIILLNELKLLVVNSKHASGTWVTIDIRNNPDKQALQKLHSTDYPDFKGRLEEKVSLWTDTADKDSIASIIGNFEDVLAMGQAIMTTLPDIDAYQDFLVRIEMESTLESIEYESDKILERLEVVLQGFKARAKQQDVEMLESFKSIRYSNIFLSIIAIVIGVIVTFYILRVVRLEEQKRFVTAERDAVQEQKDIIQEINQEIMDSINYAQRIQRTILPTPETLNVQLKEHFVFYKPRDIVSGDFYWCINHSDGNVWLAAADCTGHGVPGAFVSFVCSKALQECVQDQDITEPAAVLDKTTELVEGAFEGGVAQNVKDGMDIGLCKINIREKKVEFAGAYNPLYLIRNGELSVSNGDRQPIGAHEDRVPFTNHSIDVQEGDMLYVFSDGYIDQFGGPKGKRYMSKRFKALLTSMAEEKVAIQSELLQKEFTSWQGEEQQVDDILVIGVRI